ncbi:hypothetical protein B0H14DRAFT_3535702 [Mycena olivaceomarginata]|nr:hypothetical protein B0H14DRAFT_3535702 [Mycena olivaceomarginata]
MTTASYHLGDLAVALAIKLVTGGTREAAFCGVRCVFIVGIGGCILLLFSARSADNCSPSAPSTTSTTAPTPPPGLLPLFSSVLVDHPIRLAESTVFLYLFDSDAAQRAASVALFFITQPLPDHILSLPNISQLFAARRELYTVTRQRARRTTLPSSRSSPSPPSPSDSDDEDRVAVSDGGDLDSGEDTNDGIAVPETHELALQQPLPALRFYNGGYGGVHYSPDGHILPCVAAAVFRTPSPVLGNIHQRDSPQVLRSPSAEVGNRSSSLTLFDDDDDMELQYPPTLELNFPVAVFIWINESKQPIYQLFAPRGRDVGESECIRGKLVLGDYQTALEAAGLPIGCILQRYIDPTGDWIEFDWDKLIELYLSNRALYLRLYGLDITPPDHILELFTLN